MQNIKMLQFLRCPEDRSELRFATEELVREINASIRAGRLANAAGRELYESIDAGLIRAGGDVLYPIIHGIPLLLRDEAISLHPFKTMPN
jgi:uncharacterized protein YbaR (Trm112 family)